MITSPRLLQDLLTQKDTSASLYSQTSPGSYSKAYYNTLANSTDLKTRRFFIRDYELAETIFSPKDMPNTVRRIKQDIDRSVDPDILERFDKRWNGSVNPKPNTPKLDIGLKSAMHKVKTGVFKLPEISTSMTPKPKQSGLFDLAKERDKYMGWNFSREHVNDFKRNMSVNKITHDAQQETKKFFDQIHSEYSSPEKKVKQMNEAIKDLKRDKRKKERIEHEYRKENPFTSVESMNAAVFQKLMESHKGQKSSRTASEDIYKWNDNSINSARKDGERVYWSHTGKWGPSKFSKDREAWSCCMSEEKRSKGCYATRKNPATWEALGVY